MSGTARVFAALIGLDAVPALPLCSVVVVCFMSGRKRGLLRPGRDAGLHRAGPPSSSKCRCFFAACACRRTRTGTCTHSLRFCSFAFPSRRWHQFVCDRSLARSDVLCRVSLEAMHGSMHECTGWMHIRTGLRFFEPYITMALVVRPWDKPSLSSPTNRSL